MDDPGDVINRDGKKTYAARETRIERERRCWELHLRCWTQDRIAHELNIHQSQVNRYLQRSKARQNQDLNDLVSAYKIQQVDVLGLILSKALAAYQATGNLKALTEARGALKDLRDLLGLDAPIETSGIVDVAQLVTELEAVKARKAVGGE